jgi:hypothetical protein
MVKAKFNLSDIYVYIKNYPNSISLQDSIFKAMVIEEGRFTGNIIYNITSSYRWNLLQGVITFGFIEAVGLQEKILKEKVNFEIVIKFKTKNYIPA